MSQLKTSVAFEVKDLEIFLKTATENCYLGEFKLAETIERKGFFEMEYSQGDWNYRDSFSGFYVSTGQEIIRYKGIPVWSSNYGGGVTDKYMGNIEFFSGLESFLRTALLKADASAYSPRGPKEYTENDWKYECVWEGDITQFSGIEYIYYKNERVFYHRFYGGYIVGMKTGKYLSYLMGADAITNQELEDLDIQINQSEPDARKLVIPQTSITAYQVLIKNKLTAGFWNEMMNEEEIVFIFKSKDTDIQQITYSEESRDEIAKLCSEYSGDPIEKTTNLLEYLSDNDFYKEFVKRFYLK